jgi:6-phosphofructokinase 2
MAEIVTLTINPCIDESTTFSGLIPGKKIRCAKPTFEPGGGGINVSRAIHKLHGHSLAVYPSGGYSGKFLNELLAEEKIESLIVDTRENTRENIIVFDELTHNQYRFCMPGPALLENEWKQCLEKIESVNDALYIVASGSLPPGVPLDFFSRVASIAKNKKAKFILDTSGAPLKNALDNGIYLWKPNLGELRSFTGSDDLTTETAITTARNIILEGKVEIIVISLGAGGAMLVTK